MNANDTVYDFYVNDVTGEWSHWDTHLCNRTKSNLQKTNFSAIVVPTVHSARYRHLLFLSHAGSKVTKR
jgi:hypothetical protein